MIIVALQGVWEVSFVFPFASLANQSCSYQKHFSGTNALPVVLSKHSQYLNAMQSSAEEGSNTQRSMSLTKPKPTMDYHAKKLCIPAVQQKYLTEGVKQRGADSSYRGVTNFLAL